MKQELSTSKLRTEAKAGCLHVQGLDRLTQRSPARALVLDLFKSMYPILVHFYLPPFSFLLFISLAFLSFKKHFSLWRIFLFECHRVFLLWWNKHSHPQIIVWTLSHRRYCFVTPSKTLSERNNLQHQLKWAVPNTDSINLSAPDAYSLQGAIFIRKNLKLKPVS